jgi:hypothetical protein
LIIADSIRKHLECKRIFDPKMRYAIITDSNLFKETTRNCKKRPKRLKETFFSSSIELLYEPRSFIGKEIEETMKWLIQGGIPQYWYKYHQWHKFELGQTIKDVSEPQIFTFENMTFEFNVWMVACAVSIVGFIVEWFQVLDSRISL